MPSTCSAYGCKNRKNDNSPISFHVFPLKKPDLLRKWLDAIQKINFNPTTASRLCSEHFTESDFQLRPFAAKRMLREAAVPSIFPGLLQNLKKVQVKNRFTKIAAEVHDEPATPSTNTNEPQQMYSPEIHFEHIEVKIKTTSQGHEDFATPKTNPIEDQRRYPPPPDTKVQQVEDKKKTTSQAQAEFETIKLKKKIICLNQKLRRRNKTIKRLTEMVRSLRSKGTVHDNVNHISTFANEYYTDIEYIIEEDEDDCDSSSQS